MRKHDSAPANGLTGQMPFSLPHANPMEQSPNQLPQKLPILKYTRQREIEILSGVSGEDNDDTDALPHRG